MAEYIDKQAVLAELNKTYDKMDDFPSQFYNGYQFAINLIRNFPTADVAEVRHGRWEYSPFNGVYNENCSVCEFAPGIRFYRFRYCPHCGADMRGADNGNC